MDVEITAGSISFNGRPAHQVLHTDVTERLRTEREPGPHGPRPAPAECVQRNPGARHVRDRTATGHLPDCGGHVAATAWAGWGLPWTTSANPSARWPMRATTRTTWKTCTWNWSAGRSLWPARWVTVVRTGQPQDLGHPHRRGLCRLDRAHAGASCADTLTFTLVDLDLNRDSLVAETSVVLASSTTEIQPEQVVVTETGPNTSVFSGWDSMPSAGSVAADGLLQARDGDILSLTYVDGDDGTGQISVSYDTATADCGGPKISSLGTKMRPLLARLTVTWTTQEIADSVVEWGTQR